MTPVWSASSPEVTGASIATTTRCISGIAETRQPDDTGSPHRAGHVLKQLGLKFLPAELGGEVFPGDRQKTSAPD
jgi:hypothetical protein